MSKIIEILFLFTLFLFIIVWGIRTILKKLLQFFGAIMAVRTKISDIMPEGIYSVNIEDTIQKAHDIMLKEYIRHIPVTDDGKYVGMLTERKILEYTLRHLYDYDDDLGMAGQNKIIDFEKIMIRDLPFIYPEDSVAKAVELMLKKKIDCLPVVDWKENLLGIISSQDLLLFFHKKLNEEI